jgi:hypothetical protein
MGNKGSIIRNKFTRKYKTFEFDCRLYSLGIDIVPNGTKNVVVNVVTGDNNGGQIYMQPYNSFYFPPMVVNQIRQYAKFRMRRFQMRWSPRKGTGQEGLLFCAYFKDPNFFEAQNYDSSVTNPAEGALSTSQSCASNPVWNQMVCPVQYANQWLYSIGPTSTDAFDFSLNAANDRMTTAGVYGVFCSGIINTSTTDTIILGDIFMRMEIDCDEMDLQPTGNITMFNPSKHPKSLHNKVKALEEKMASIFFDDPPVERKERKVGTRPNSRLSVLSPELKKD